MISSITLFLRLDAIKKDGSAPLYLRFIENRNKVDISSGVSLSTKKKFTKKDVLAEKPQDRAQFYCWNQEKQRVTAGNRNAESLNLLLASHRRKAMDILVKYDRKEEKLTKEKFKKEFAGKGNTKDLAVDYFLYQLEKTKDNYSAETFRSYSSILTKLRDFAPKLKLCDINEVFLVKYQEYLIKPLSKGGKGNDQRTIANNLKIIKTFVNIAVKKGEILKEDNPFLNFQIKKGKAKNKRSFVEPDELNLLQSLIKEYQPLDRPMNQLSSEEWQEREAEGQLTPSEFNVLSYFLFSCYTGLRYKDMQLLDYSDIKKRKILTDKEASTFKEQYFIDIDMHKTGFNITIPLLSEAQNLIDVSQTSGKVFQVISNQKTNIKLRQIIEKVKIDKKITFHCARHTFASVALMYDLPDKFVQNILGHQNSKTTEIYSHVVDDYLFKHANTLSERLTANREKDQKKEKPKKKSKDAKSLMERLGDIDMDKLEKALKLLDMLGGE